MTKPEVMMVIVSLLAGAALGAFYFGGLAWTVTRGIASKRPATWFLGSFVSRTAVVLTGFYLAGDGDWLRLLICLLGFVIARSAVTRRARTPMPGQAPVAEARNEA